jgi:Protein of unknown function (DUF4239)
VPAITVSLIAFAAIFGGVIIGVLLRLALPEHHLAEDTKDVVRLCTGLIGTIAALVLGLLIASANSSFETQATQVRRLGANIILLDRLLAHYGPEARTARDLLRRAIGPLVDRIWQEHASAAGGEARYEATAAGAAAGAAIESLSPQTDLQRSLKAQAIQIVTDLAQTRLLLFEARSSSIPTPFLTVLIFWLTMIFVSFSLFSRLQATLIAVLFVSALSAAGAIYLILDLSQPFTGLMQISSAPLRNALAPLEP